jgi:hypothetical protein
MMNKPSWLMAAQNDISRGVSDQTVDLNHCLSASTKANQ